MRHMLFCLNEFKAINELHVVYPYLVLIPITVDIMFICIPLHSCVLTQTQRGLICVLIHTRTKGEVGAV